MTTTQIQQLPFLYVNDLQTSKASNTTVGIAPGRCRDVLNLMDIVVPNALTINAAVNGVLGLDVGTLAASTAYYVHVIADTTSFGAPSALLSLSRTAPVLPAPYNTFRNVGWVLTDGSVHILQFWQGGNSNARFYQWDVPISVLSGGASATFAAVSLAAAMPLLSLPAYLNAAYTPNAAGNVAAIRPTGSAAAAAANAAVVISSGVTGHAQYLAMIKVLPLLATGNPSIDYIVQASDALSLSVAAFDYYI